MGDIADDIIEGIQCDSCGCIFRDKEAEKALTPEQKANNESRAYTHGHPATCWDCWNDMPKAYRKYHHRARVETF